MATRVKTDGADRVSAAIAAIVFAALAAALLSALVGFRDEWRVHVAMKALRDGSLAAFSSPSGSALPARAALIDAIARIDASNGAIAPSDRDTLRAEARSLISHAEGLRPDWASAAAVTAFLDSVTFGESDPRTLAAYELSYRRGGYLLDFAPWRIRYGLAQWTRLTPAAQTAMSNEAAWYSALPRGYAETMAEIVDKPAEPAVMRARAEMMRGRQTSDMLDPRQ